MSGGGEEKKRSVAFIGTGLMGGPMARRLLGAGFSVTVWNRSVDKAEALVADGAVVAASPADAAKGADIVITMLSDGKAVGEVLFEAGVAEALKKGLSSSTAARLRRRSRVNTPPGFRRLASITSMHRFRAVCRARRPVRSPSWPVETRR